MERYVAGRFRSSARSAEEKKRVVSLLNTGLRGPNFMAGIPSKAVCAVKSPLLIPALCESRNVGGEKGRQRERRGIQLIQSFLNRLISETQQRGGCCLSGCCPCCRMKATAPGDVCGGITSYGRLNRNGEYQLKSSLNRRYRNPARKNLSNILQTLITPQRN